jgi:alkylation response protein AidB-like acyl-CoA dehydrogenase
MDLEWSPADLAFRDEVRAFLDEELTPDLRRAGRLMTSLYADHDASMRWQAIRHERGWAVQLHGGMGMTRELAIGHYFTRLTAIEYELGPVDQHLLRYAELSARRRGRRG